MPKLTIEERIRKNYCAETGDWIIDRGKMTEAKLLKEACEEIESLKQANRELNASFNKIQREGCITTIWHRGPDCA